MYKIAALREERKNLLAKMEECLNSEEFKAEDYDVFESDLKSVELRMEKLEALQARQSELEEATPIAGHTRPVAPEAVKEFSSLDEMVDAVVATSEGVVDPRLNDLFVSTSGKMRGEQSFGVGAKGGFMIPTVFQPTVLRVDPATTPLLSMVNTMPVGNPPDARLEIPALDQDGAAPDNQFGGVSVQWIAEGAAKPETDGDLRKVYLQPKEVAGHIKITDMLQDNWSGAGSFYGTLLSQALAWAKETSLWSGNGVGRPSGILNHASRIDINRNGAGTIDYDDIVTMKSRQIYRGGGTKIWLANQATMPVLDQLANTNGNLIFKRDSIAEGSPATLEGYPIFWYENSSALGVRGDLALVQLDPYYLYKPGTGPLLAMGHSGDDFINNKHTLKIFQRIDGNSWLTQPYTLASGLTVSPFVFLDVP